ncbi:MAG: acyl-ACP--UDP-N-acetylglucosamine O-acyltransferase [Deltaproteobacteria bacterium]|jgi:UDP-N-acetylglucosamine acyltransferase|nr:acyl-ACP--UDP-N-acetylglucosamine O-acyltransferase [Deltaproteobacteria bacterium]MBT4091730.1 acyl-ACP--UDP-N-acetylglucosamine O-acyltransferase [Deltaproteobacteria bacterium]MBT4269247.1 acyl-ACP--UDP-N-acetylglucosamine O-acyltransferase [Deltaproteobacteria bacterium]MBT4639238.1 acyl-ACP--UDP-N-acetylglucosamine O-acyltransferase [Deltaproteobacteria bacterium]MBT6505133.1 acyl-ACP--UDP-N-acetylglucosamine O-acyltransferase [Deltaproteobacteria bacterium]
MIHQTAIIDPEAKLHSSVEVGAYSVIGPGVEIGADCRIAHHVVIEGPTKIGAGSRIFPFASLGLEPQDKKFQGEQSYLEIGSHNTIREYVTINRGTEVGGGTTKLGDHGWIMAYCHIAHDCIVGDHVTMSNGATLGGHVVVKDYANIGGLSGVHQFCRIGEYAIVGGQSMITQDVVPFAIAAGNRAKLAGVNYIGLDRRGFTSEEIDIINQAFKIFFKNGLTRDVALLKLKEEFPESAHIGMFVDFIQSSERGVCR